MSNVIRLSLPTRRQSAAERHAALVACFADFRRHREDVFWLKENAELLNILESTGVTLEAADLAPMAEFYAEIEKRMGFFPQYYRFLLSLCLDLEDLGLPGSKGEVLAQWVARQGLAEMELSDLQRAEARRLMSRRGVEPIGEDGGLTDRLRAFMDRSQTFAMPNKKAAYELTHIVFYLSEYGRRDPELSPAAITSLEFAGILAYLEQNADLLAEVCIAMRFAGVTPSSIWEDWLAGETRRFVLQAEAGQGGHDAYHDYFVCSWLSAVSGGPGFEKTVEAGPMTFLRGRAASGPLREISECMFRLQDARSDDWQRMRNHVAAALSSEDGYDILTEAEQSSDKFDAFFAGFARTGLTGVAL